MERIIRFADSLEMWKHMAQSKDATIADLLAALERIDKLAAAMAPDEMARPSLIRHTARAALKLAKGE